jgi:membrane dipeptidase
MVQYRVALAEEVESRRAAGIGATGETADIVPFIPDMRGPDQFRKLEGLLKERGYSDSRIDKILGGNFLRLMDDVWSGSHIADAADVT